MSAHIYLEGGGDSKELHTRCREGFRRLIENCGFRGRMPRLIACGSRDSAFEDFKRAHGAGASDEYIALWIDSEEPMEDINRAWEHLHNVTTVSKWEKPDGAEDNQVLFMTTCMETWIIADRATLKEHYDKSLLESALPPLDNLEQRSRHEVQEDLAHATWNCSNSYKKGRRSFDLLGKLTPAVLEHHLPSFVRVRRILADRL
ncbi:MAG: DUF4276 family protein [Candidatus Eremiobacteraeota bacterium]|nr:DUF4276 family protein [Candidatus Eremiobacteraeota bacterium]